MKKFFALAALVSVALTGCVTNETFDDELQSEIAFEAVNKVPNKAIIEGAAFGDDNKFQTWGFYSNDSFTTNTPFGLYNKTIEKVDGTWKVKNETYYWPISGEVDFISLYPETLAPSSVDYTNGITLTGYTVTGDNEFLYAEKKGSKGSSPLAMVFNHALAQVEVQVLTAADYRANATFKINSITLKNVDVTADFVQKPTASWTNNTNAQTDTEPYCADQLEVTSTIANYGTGVVVIPQTLATTTDKETRLSINYTLTQNGADATGVVEPILTGSWEVGTKHIYKLTFKLDEITFNPSVTDWVGVETVTIPVN